MAGTSARRGPVASPHVPVAGDRSARLSSLWRGRNLGLAAAALLAAGAVTGCGHGGAAAPLVTAGTLPSASGTSGCGHHRATGSPLYSVTVSGHRRVVLVHVPAGYWTYSVPAAARLWAGQDRCAASPQVTSGSGYRLTKCAGCTGGAVVELYAIRGEGHEWPGGPAMPAVITSVLGPQSDALNASSLMWAFFEAHPLL